MILKINDRIRNKRVHYFNEFRVSLRYDSVASTFQGSAYFDPQNTEHRDLFCIGHYHTCSLEHNGELIMTGYILSETFNSGVVPEPVVFAGYSLPGVLEDCNIPVSLYPLQSDELSLREIAEKLIEPFGLKMVIDPEVSDLMEEIYDTTKAKESQTVKAYITELAVQKNIIVTHNERGNLVFTKAKTNQNPVIDFGNIPGVRMNLSFNGQQMHSEITVMKEADMDGGNAGEVSIKNPFVPYVFRPKTIVQTSGDDIDTEYVAKMALAEELKNLQLTITVDRWDVRGRLIKPNSIIAVQNSDIYLYKKTKWFVQEVEYTGNYESMTATLKCVLPEVYNGEMPEYLFKGINLH